MTARRKSSWSRKTCWSARSKKMVSCARQAAGRRGARARRRRR